jgi:hypothetical protein
MALLDVMHTEQGFPRPLLDAVLSHQFAAIVMDATPEKEGYLAMFVHEYPHVENIGIQEPWVVTGFPTPSPGRSICVLRR